MKKLISIFLILVSTGQAVLAATPSTTTISNKEEIKKDIEEIEKSFDDFKQEVKLEKKTKKEAEKQAKAIIKQSKKETESLNPPLTSEGQKVSVAKEGEKKNEQQIIRLEVEDEKNQSKVTGSKPKKNSKSEIDKVRQELKENEEKALDFVFPSIDDSAEKASREKFFSQTEKEQLLELWRATLARNRTIQFIIKSLSSNPNEVEQNNVVMQALSKALFVPFYAMSAVANNSLVSGGSMVGARVIGDVVDATTDKADRSRQITKTDLIVLFMLVDDVAERLRRAYYGYKDALIEKRLLGHELIPARMDASEALAKNEKSSVFFTRMVVRDLERKLRLTEHNYLSNRRTLLELAGEQAVESVDMLIKLEVDEMISDITRV